ncbi:MAG TPA: hydroxymethylglutaryl-CoA reductase, partial [Ktedonobacterales bacterium]|nr:hydroxymethylglutaryl-CoA reductase [Ktedonobacterales bacterium]
AKPALLDEQTLRDMDLYGAQIEHFIGTVKAPVGVAGPLRVRGRYAHGDYTIPLATTESALVASYHRGAQLITAACGCRAVLIEEGVGRAPGFVFETVDESLAFAAWIETHDEEFRRAAATTTRHGKLIGHETTIAGNHVYVLFQFVTGDAAGQNMATLAAQAICEYIMAASPVQPRAYFIEANLSRDKRQSARAFSTVRGRKVTAEIVLPARLVRSRLRTTPRLMADYARMATVGALISGTIGIHGQLGNGLAALFLACGQDVASVTESSVGVSRAEVTDAGDLYATITLPNLIVGTVGGGTRLPSQRACLDILGLAEPNSAHALAEVCAAMCLAGELSLVGALCSGDFTRAHRTLGRGHRNGRAPVGE